MDSVIAILCFAILMNSIGVMIVAFRLKSIAEAVGKIVERNKCL